LYAITRVVVTTSVPHTIPTMSAIKSLSFDMILSQFK
jgi:hypothetical protein